MVAPPPEKLQGQERAIGESKEWIDYLWRRPTYGLSSVLYSLKGPFVDPWCLPSGMIAGFLARASIMPIVGYDKSLPYNQTASAVCRRRALYFGVFAVSYFPVHRLAQWDRNDLPYDRLWRMIWAGFVAGALARGLTNPWVKTHFVACRNRMPFSHAARYIYRSDFGVANFWVNEHPIIPHAIYTAALMTSLEASRRAVEVAGMYPSETYVVPRALVHGGLATVCAAFASALCYGFSSKQAAGAFVRRSVLTEGRVSTIRKEAPLMGFFFFYFSLLQPFFAPAHERCGLGY